MSNGLRTLERRNERTHKKMVALAEKPKPVKQLTQKGLMHMLYRLIERAGGKVNFTADSLGLPVGSNLHIQYNADTDSFDVQSLFVKTEIIISPPEKRLIV